MLVGDELASAKVSIVWESLPGNEGTNSHTQWDHLVPQRIIPLIQLKVSNWQNEYDALKAESAEMQEKYERRLKEVKREKK